MIESIRTRLITAFIGLTVIPLILLGGVLVWEDYIGEIERTKQTQQRKTDLAAENVSLFLHEQENKILTLMRMNYFPDMTRKEQQDELIKFLSTAKDKEHGYIFDNFILLDADGEETFRVSRTYLVQTDETADWSKSDIYKIPSTTGEIYYSPVFFSKETGEPTLDMGLPIIDLRTLKTEGILIAEMKLKFMWHQVALLKLGKKGHSFLTDQNGRVIVHPNRSIVLKNTHFDVPQETTIMPGLNGEKSIVVAQKISFGNLPLYFVTEVPVSEALGYIYSSLFTIGAILLLTLSASLALVYVLVRQFVHPLESLAQTAREISDGNYAKTAQLFDIVEFRELSEAFNAMMLQRIIQLK